MDNSGEQVVFRRLYMPRVKKTKASFKYDSQGRAILGSAKEMATWVKIGFNEQDKRKSSDDPFYRHYIDLSNCVLYISYPIGGKTPSSTVFNLCDIAGVVQGIEEIEGDPNYLYEVKYDIHLENSVLYGNFFHYVKFNGMVNMDDTIVQGSFSCFRCLFDGFVYMQRIHLQGGFDFEQCEFNQGLIMSGAVVESVNAKFNNCLLKKRLSLKAASFTNQRIDNYVQSILLTNSTVENLNISGIITDGLPLYIQDSSIQGMEMNNIKTEGVLGLYSCVLDGINTVVTDVSQPNNRIKEMVFHGCNIKAQCHIENCDIDKLTFSFGRIDDSGRLRFSQCNIDDLMFGSSSVLGRMDIIKSTIAMIDFDETCVPGYLSFQDNYVEDYENRQTLRLLKNEALKVNDDVSAQHFYVKEMQSLLSDNSISFWDKISLWLNKVFSKFGASWIRALCLTFFLSVALTFLMLGFGSEKYMFNPSGRFIGWPIVTIILDSINVFSIPLFSDTIKEYELNVFGQMLYFVIKIIVAYGTYQFVVSFRKHVRG